MKLVTVNEMKQIEEEANLSGYPYAEMMEDAGTGIARFIHSLFADIKPDLSAIGVVGSGNNGGDTLIALEHLQKQGWTCLAYLVRSRPAGDPLLLRAREAGCQAASLEKDVDFKQLNAWMEHADVLLDGILGTGAQLPLRKDIAAVLKDIANQPSMPFVAAVDCPSGVNCDTGDAAAETLQADLTLCMGAVKQGMLKLPAFQYVNDINLIPLKFDGKSTCWEGIQTIVVDEGILEEAFPTRPLDAHKGTFGTLMVAAGSVNYTGAALLAGKAAYRSGVGLVQMAVPSSLHSALAGVFPEATWLMLPHEMGVISSSAAEVIWENLDRATALAVGPGLGTEPATRDFLKNLLSGEKGGVEKGAIGFLGQKEKHNLAGKSKLPPVVIDADGLRLLSQLPDWPGLLPAESVLTPHPGEMAALSGLTVEDIQKERIEITRRFARKWNCVVVLKGAFSVVGEPGGQCAVIPFATPALARAGTGDVLTGIIASLLAQGKHPYLAARAGAYLHALAGLSAAEKLGTPVSVMAGDLLEEIPNAIGK